MVTCLALNIYHEARGESIQGMQAVALVTRNRMRVTDRNACEVVHSPYQFSWTIYKPKATDPKSYKLAEKIAIDVLTGKVSDLTGGATFYHHIDVNPHWAKKFIYRKTIGKHKFYFTLERPL
jgi:spore germination cell wall hydrolase CwlJ-like protein